MTAIRRIVLLGLLALALPAQAVDPRLSWRTLESEHFELHFPDGGYAMALKAAGYLEAAHARLVPRLGHAPWRKTQVVLTDDLDGANGSATSLPIPRVHAFMSPPDAASILDNYDDYFWLLLVHEYAHVLHLDTVGGLPELGNRVFGNVFGPNFLQPTWIVEGLATYYETELSGAGRNRSARADMYLRTQVLEEGGLWPVDRANGSPIDWPGGTLWYLYGGRIMAHVAALRGEPALGAVSRDYGGRTLPFALNASSSKAMDLPFAEAYASWAEAEAGRHRAVIEGVRAAGEVRGTRITDLGRRVASPRFTPDGSALLAYVSDGRAYPAVRRLDLPRKTPARLGELPVVQRISAGGRFDLDPTGQVLVYTSADHFQQEQIFDDLWAAPVDGGAPVRLTYGMRARDPALSAQGGLLAFVANRRGETGVYVMRAELEAPGPGAPLQARLGAPRRVFHLEGAQVDQPAFSPDGGLLAFSVHRRGRGREIAAVDLRGLGLPGTHLLARAGEVRQSGPSPEPFLRPDQAWDRDPPEVQWVTDDAAQAADPVFDPQGRYLLFSSERSGIYDLYAREVKDGRVAGPLRRITRTLTGAFQPAISPDGTALAYVDYTAEGHDLALMPLSPEAWFEPGPAEPVGEPGHPAPSRVWPVRPYSPWATLRPFYWAPLLGVDTRGTTLGVSTGGSDIVGRHAWTASAWWGLSSGQPGYRLAYAYDGLFPAVSAGSARGVRVGAVSSNGVRAIFEEVSWELWAAGTFFFPHLDRSQSVGLVVSADRRIPLSGLRTPGPESPSGPRPVEGTATRVTLRWSGSTVHRFAESISPEEGVAARISTTVATRALGGDFDWIRVQGGATGYLQVPFLARHVLALNLEAGAGAGDFGGRDIFALGGLTFDDPVLALYEGRGFGGPALRGYLPYAFSGDAYALANLEWRVPLLEPQRGLFTLPLDLRRVTAALFSDVGAVQDVPIRPRAGDLKVGIGAELRVEATVGYNLGLLLRAGWAYGLSEGGVSAPFLGLGGVF